MSNATKYTFIKLIPELETDHPNVCRDTVEFWRSAFEGSEHEVLEIREATPDEVREYIDSGGLDYDEDCDREFQAGWDSAKEATA